jgi:HAD superfamily hydrolase (TIGR01509 family)
MFDLDGTLVDSMNCYYSVFLEVFGELGLPVVDKPELMALMRHGRNILELLIPEDWPDRTAFTERCRVTFRDRWDQRSLTDISLHPNVAPTLHELHQRGLKIGLATAARGSWIQHVLEAGGVAGCFQAVVTASDAKARKPAPDILLECLRQLEREPEGAMYVGDSPIDVLAAKAAGVRSVGVLCGASDRAALEETEPELILEHVGQLPAVLPNEEHHHG